MRILILEDEPLIAMDLEDIVGGCCDAECVFASSVDGALRHVEEGVDFAMLDFHLGRDSVTSLPVASRLLERRIPFCFVSGSLGRLPAMFTGVPRVSKPFRARDIHDVLPR